MFALFLLLVNFSLQQNTEPKIIIVTLKDSECTNEKKNLKFSLDSSLDNNENVEITLSSEKIEIKTSCKFENGNDNTLSCIFAQKMEDGIYYIEKITSPNYVYILNIPSSVFYRISSNTCDYSYDELMNINSLFKDNIIEITPIDNCYPEIYLNQTEFGAYYQLSCSKGNEKYNCRIPSSLSIGDKGVSIVTRNKCGLLNPKKPEQIMIYDISINGNKFISKAQQGDYYFIITSTIKFNNIQNENDKTYSLPLKYKNSEQFLSFNSCVQINTNIPYIYNCTIKVNESTKEGVFDLQYYYDNDNSLPFPSTYSLTLYKPFDFNTSLSPNLQLNEMKPMEQYL